MDGSPRGMFFYTFNMQTHQRIYVLFSSTFDPYHLLNTPVISLFLLQLILSSLLIMWI